MDEIEDERKHFFQSAIDSAREEYENDHENVQALTRWGGALIEMSHLHRGDTSTALIDEGISKLQSALILDPNRHDALWCLGNAYTTKGFMMNTDRSLAQDYFDKALEAFIRAKELDPTNDIYIRAIEITQQAPQMYDEIHRQMMAMQDNPDPGLSLLDEGPSLAGSSFGPSTSTNRKQKSANADFWWDVAGWVCLIGIGFVLLSMAQKPSPTK